MTELERQGEATPEETLESLAIEPEDNPSDNSIEYEIPEKYRGKTATEIIHMHQEAEKLLGKQSGEVGELRKVVDTYIQSQLKAPEEKNEQITEVDFFDNPQEAINRSIENHPKIKQAEEASWNYNKQASLAEMERRHPDMYDIVKDEKFVDWIKASPVRSRLLLQADREFDVDAGDELMTLWKERQNIAKQTVEMEKQARKDSLKQASSSGGSGTGEVSRKTYRRSDIIKMMKEDPDRYAALSDEIMQAYAEGRVK